MSLKTSVNIWKLSIGEHFISDTSTKKALCLGNDDLLIAVAVLHLTLTFGIQMVFPNTKASLSRHKKEQKNHKNVQVTYF